MKRLRILLAHFEDECNGVEEYVGDALTNKAGDPSLFKAYSEMAQAEYSHATTIKDQVVRIVNELDGDDVPERIKDIWEDQHKKMIKELNKAKNYLDMLR